MHMLRTTSLFRKSITIVTGVAFTNILCIYILAYPYILLINLYSLKNSNNPLHFQLESPQAT